MIFLVARWSDPWNRLVMCSDASEGGWGLGGGLFSTSLVSAVGRVPERSRWKRLPPGSSARQHALSSLGLAEAAGLDPSALVQAELSIEEGSPRWVPTTDFPEVPSSMLDPPKWSQEGFGK